MIKLNNREYIIGVDVGYGYMKTANSIMENGTTSMLVEPTELTHTMQYKGNYFKVGEGRALITRTKVESEDTRLLIFAGIANELDKENVLYGRVHLAVGLPFLYYGAGKKETYDYIDKDRMPVFDFEGKRYQIYLNDIFVFPQGFSAISNRISDMDSDYAVIDLGSRTTDVIYIKDKIPFENKSVTIETALIKEYRNIQKILATKHGGEIPESEIQKAILGFDAMLTDEQTAIIDSCMFSFVNNLESEISEHGIDLNYLKVIYTGGGASVVKKYSMPRKNVSFECDIHANAKGYEYLAKLALNRKGVW